MTPQETTDFIVFVIFTCFALFVVIMFAASVIVPAEDEAKREPINDTITVFPSL